LSVIGSLSLGILVGFGDSIFYAALPVWGNREIIRRVAVYEFFVAVMPPSGGGRLFFVCRHCRLLALPV
jgi:hypothetical protein